MSPLALKCVTGRPQPDSKLYAKSLYVTERSPLKFNFYPFVIITIQKQLPFPPWITVGAAVDSFTFLHLNTFLGV